MSNTSLIPSKEEIDILQVIAKSAAESQHFTKMGGLPGIFTLALYARELGIPVLTALYGGLQNIQGRITMSAEMMNNLIRQKGHRLEIKESSEQKCQIKGTRKDTNEHYESTFTIQDAQRAGLIKSGGGWEKYPSQMLFARCISKLARRLFPDVIGGSYVDGELDDLIDDKRTKTVDAKVVPIEPEKVEHKAQKESRAIEEKVEFISSEDAEKIESLICPDDKEGPESYRTNLLKFFATKYKLAACEDFTAVPVKALKGIFKSVHSRNDFLITQQESQANG